MQHESSRGLTCGSKKDIGNSLHGSEEEKVENRNFISIEFFY
jgi:hypothetical protein